MTLTIYSRDYDKDENIVNEGFSNTVFVENKSHGLNFSVKDNDNLRDAVEYIVERNIDIDEIIYNYTDEKGEKRFKKFILSSGA